MNTKKTQIETKARGGEKANTSAGPVAQTCFLSLPLFDFPKEQAAEFENQTLRYLLWLHDNSQPNQKTGPKIAKRSAAGKRTLTRAYCTVSSPAPSVQCPPHFHKRTQPPGLSGPGSIADIDWAGFSTEIPRHG